MTLRALTAVMALLLGFWGVSARSSTWLDADFYRAPAADAPAPAGSARAYAPELEPLGIAMAAPATDLETLMSRDFASDGGRNLTAMTRWAWSKVYAVPMQPVLAPNAIDDVDRLAGECLESPIDFIVRWHVAAPLKQRFLRVADITQVAGRLGPPERAGQCRAGAALSAVFVRVRFR